MTCAAHRLHVREPAIRVGEKVAAALADEDLRGRRCRRVVEVLAREAALRAEGVRDVREATRVVRPGLLSDDDDGSLRRADRSDRCGGDPRGVVADERIAKPLDLRHRSLVTSAARDEQGAEDHHHHDRLHCSSITGGGFFSSTPYMMPTSVAATATKMSAITIAM